MKNIKTKFIIFGQSRSGSTLLLDLITKHPGIRCDNEIFNKRLLFPGFRPLQYFFRSYPQFYLNYKLHSVSNPVYGFKLFFFQVHHPEKCLRHLASRDWKMIHIHREDILQQSLSNIIALTTEHWHRKTGEDPGLDSIRVEPERLLRVLRNRTRWHEKEKHLIRNYPHRTVVYENDLMKQENWQSTADKIFDYLNICKVSVDSELKPTYQKPYQELISNYDELTSAVKKSPFAYLLNNQTRTTYEK